MVISFQVCLLLPEHSENALDTREAVDLGTVQLMLALITDWLDHMYLLMFRME